MAEYKPLYRKIVSQARALGELPQWRESFRENIVCAKAIDAAIRDGYDGMHLRDGLAAELTEQFGLDRMAWVLAASLHLREGDGRFSRENYAWGEAQRISWDDHAGDYCCNSHSVLLNDLISDFREVQQAAVQMPETMRIRIFQINRDRDPEHMKFCGLEELGGRAVNSASYDRVFTGEIVGNNLEDPTAIPTSQSGSSTLPMVPRS